jgi:hypothetical protein
MDLQGSGDGSASGKLSGKSRVGRSVKSVGSMLPPGGGGDGGQTASTHHGQRRGAWSGWSSFVLASPSIPLRRIN